ISVYMIIARVGQNVTPECNGVSNIRFANRPLFVNGLDMREVRTLPLEALNFLAPYARRWLEHKRAVAGTNPTDTDHELLFKWWNLDIAEHDIFLPPLPQNASDGCVVGVFFSLATDQIVTPI